MVSELGVIETLPMRIESECKAHKRCGRGHDRVEWRNAACKSIQI